MNGLPRDAAVVRRAAVNSPLQEASFTLRTEVFVHEQGVPIEQEIDEHDRLTTTRHLVIPADGTADVGPAVASVRWIVEPPGYEGADPSWGEIAHLQRLVVARVARGRGLGRQLVGAVEHDARADHLRVVMLAAQTQAIAFYERLGYAASGPEFDDAGLPHRWMTKLLDDAARPPGADTP